MWYFLSLCYLIAPSPTPMARLVLMNVASQHNLEILLSEDTAYIYYKAAEELCKTLDQCSFCHVKVIANLFS